MIKKASIFLATYNKGLCLYNTLKSIALQETTFPFEVCIVDDHSDIDPKPIIEELLEPVSYTYMRLKEHVGFKHSQSICLDLMSKDSDAIVLQSCDVIHSSKDTVQRLCSPLTSGTFTMAEVRNIQVVPYLHSIFEDRIGEYLTQEAMDEQPPGTQIYYSGTKQPNPRKRWYFFLGAILKEDLLRTTYRNNCYDVELSNELHRLGFNVLYLDDVVGIHQRH